MGQIRIRTVPDDVHRTLEARAAGEGVSLSEHLLREVAGLAQRQTPAELSATKVAGAVDRQLAQADSLHAPRPIDLDLAAALRRAVATGRIEAERRWLARAHGHRVEIVVAGP
ncbi:MAG TPA: hypothetical protein VFB42_10625 [Gaiellaceae bacterium]|nr:hypothetical protein [Gaiellaceae bacterium]